MGTVAEMGTARYGRNRAFGAWSIAFPNPGPHPTRKQAAIINLLHTTSATPNAPPPGPPSPTPLVVFAGHGKTAQRTAAVDGTAEGTAGTLRWVYVDALVRCLGSEGRN